MTFFWAPPVADSKPKGTRVWRVYLKGGHEGARSFCFGLWVGHDEAHAKQHATQWGEVIAVEAIT